MEWGVRSWIIIGLLTLSFVGRSTSNVSRDNASDYVTTLTTDFFKWRLQNSPEYGTKYGYRALDGDLEQYTEAAMDQQVAQAKVFLARVEPMILPDLGLTQQEKISLQVLKDLLTTFIDGYRYRKFGFYVGLSIYDNPLSELKGLVNWMKFKTVEDYKKALRRYSHVATFFEQKRILLEKARTDKRMRPISIIESVIGSFDDFSQMEPNETFFYEPFKNMSDIINATIMRQQVVNIITNEIKPAAKKYVDYIRDFERPGKDEAIGLSVLDDGYEIYSKCLRWHLSLDITPEKIFETGKKEVYRISKEIKRLLQAANFKGNFKSYMEYLKRDPNNMFNGPDDMFEAFKNAAKEIKRKIPTILDNPPNFPPINIVQTTKGPIGKYVEPALDGSRNATFYANVINATARPRFSVMALTLHEVEPGHHTQMAFSNAQDIPLFRRLVEYRKYYAVPFNWPFYTAYAEGWALYAESLGTEMGLYKDPKIRLGAYISEILRACRLVVDAGIHKYGWTSQKAEDYLSNYTELSLTQIKLEVKRYTSYPGQATSYKIGELTIKRLRLEAEVVLKDNFNLKEFHRVVLELGPVPLDLLEKIVRHWIEEVLVDLKDAPVRSSGTKIRGVLVLNIWLVCFGYVGVY